MLMEHDVDVLLPLYLQQSKIYCSVIFLILYQICEYRLILNLFLYFIFLEY
jgi:hypothetical protein